MVDVSVIDQVYLNCRFLQHNNGFEPLKNLRYSIYITTQKGESEPMDSPY
jgi:hypothetical protein